MVALKVSLLITLGLNILSTLALPTKIAESALDPTQPVLVVKLKHGVRPTQGNPTETSVDFSSVQESLDEHGATLKLMFGEDEDKLIEQLKADELATDMASFYHVQGPSEELDQLAKKLFAEDLVEAAYVRPASSLPVMVQPKPKDINDRRRSATPNFVSRQTYLGPAPIGINAIPYASGLLGGRGRGVQIVDVEQGWRFNHEDLKQGQGGLIGGKNEDGNHGTAVAGVIGGDNNDFGITGIAPDADFRGSSRSGQSLAGAIKKAADNLNTGDVMLLEIQIQGPAGKGKWLPIEWWPDHFAAIQYATAKGIIVVEAAGNGNQSLDDPMYEKPSAGFPSGWKNPFNASNPQSGAIMVGAGASHPTENKTSDPERSRLGFSNYGARVDCQGWGSGVVTTGYGDLQGGSDQDRWYTDKFSGTSSASPIVTGALAVLQGVVLANGQQPLKPERIIELLRTTGSPQMSDRKSTAYQRIGNLPDLKQLIAAALDGEPRLDNCTTAGVKR